MKTNKRIRPATAFAALAGGAALAMILAGCVQQTPSPTGSPSASSSASSAPSSTPSATATATGVPSIPVTIACASLITAQQVYDYNPNYVAVATYTPAPGTPQAQAKADQGQACAWLNETSGVKLEVSVARPGDLASLKSAASGTKESLGAAAVGYFNTVGNAGQFQVFSGSYWIVISSPDISATSDADPIAKDVLGNISAG